MLALVGVTPPGDPASPKLHGALSLGLPGAASPQGMLACLGEPPKPSAPFLGELGSGRDGMESRSGAGPSPEDQIPLGKPRRGPTYWSLIHTRGPQTSLKKWDTLSRAET